jgi:hypothetical protein
MLNLAEGYARAADQNKTRRGEPAGYRGDAGMEPAYSRQRRAIWEKKPVSARSSLRRLSITGST